jgi:hypothetical protein
MILCDHCRNVLPFEGSETRIGVFNDRGEPVASRASWQKHYCLPCQKDFVVLVGAVVRTFQFKEGDAAPERILAFPVVGPNGGDGNVSR